jgi:hypothetical protein
MASSPSRCTSASINGRLLLLLLLAWLFQTVIRNLNVLLPPQQIASQQDQLDGAFRCYLEGGLLKHVSEGQAINIGWILWTSYIQNLAKFTLVCEPHSLRVT